MNRYFKFFGHGDSGSNRFYEFVHMKEMSTYLRRKADVLECFILTPGADYVGKRTKREFVKRCDDKLFTHTDEASQRDREC